MTVSNRFLHRSVRAFAATILLALSAPALANITLPGGDSEGNGDFNLSPFEYGSTGTGYLSTLLFVQSLGGTLQPADQVSGIPGLQYSYTTPPAGLGSPVVEIVYSLVNNSAVTLTNLRFMFNLQPDGSPSFQDVVEVNWPAKGAGDPDRFQVEDLNSAADFLKNTIASNNGVTDGLNNCGLAVCDADFALQWDRASLAPGERWDIALRLVDDSDLVIGGRYLHAIADPANGTEIVFGNPTLIPETQAYVMLLAGLALLALLRMRRT
jgi:hypothetical protein